MTIRQAKRAMRAEVKARILALEPGLRSLQELAIRNRFEHLPGLARAQTILLFASHFPEEFSTWPLLEFRDRDRPSPGVPEGQSRGAMFGPF